MTISNDASNDLSYDITYDISYNISNDLSYNITYDISYDITYGITCDVNMLHFPSITPVLKEDGFNPQPQIASEYACNNSKYFG